MLRLPWRRCGLRRNRRSCGDRNETGSEHAGHPRSRPGPRESTLDDFNINNFSDYLIQPPGITAPAAAPGQNTIYIRGVASTTPNLTTAGVAGLAPNVALYLDEQPLSQPGRNLDVYTADMARVEVLPAPGHPLEPALKRERSSRTNKRIPPASTQT